MMNEEQYIAMMREDMKENFTMSFRNRPSQISVPRALFDNPKYAQLSTGAKCLYILMLDRLFLLSTDGSLMDGSMSRKRRMSITR